MSPDQAVMLKKSDDATNIYYQYVHMKHCKYYSDQRNYNFLRCCTKGFHTIVLLSAENIVGSNYILQWFVLPIAFLIFIFRSDVYGKLLTGTIKMSDFFSPNRKTPQAKDRDMPKWYKTLYRCNYCEEFLCIFQSGSNIDLIDIIVYNTGDNPIKTNRS